MLLGERALVLRHEPHVNAPVVDRTRPDALPIVVYVYRTSVCDRASAATRSALLRRVLRLEPGGVSIAMLISL